MRKSAKYIAQELINYTTSDVYDIWKDMGIIVKEKGDWVLTELGRSIGGRMAKSNHTPVPTFESEKIIDLMIEFYKKHHK